jgi:hypothetical protein
VKWIVAWTALLVPLLGVACDSTGQRTCQKRIEQLIAHRTSAMQGAFGDLFALPANIAVKFIWSDDPKYGFLDGKVGYDHEIRTLLVSRRFLSAKTPNPLRMAAYYWPFYDDGSYRKEFAVIGAIDDALWTAYLQEAAKAKGLSWPHAGCASVEVGKRLPCEMLLAGIAEHLTAVRTPIFNENLLNRIWPEDFSSFQKSVWLQDREYLDVRRYGGILLLKPLIAQFGVPRALAYIAQTPFEVEETSLRVAAKRYQQRAREVLTAHTVTPVEGGMPVAHVLSAKRSD